jgi:hypothetical protein
MADRLPSLTHPDDVIFSPPDTSRIFTFLSDRMVLEPTSQMVNLSDRRLFVIRTAQSDVPSFDAWLARFKVISQEQALASINNSAQKGGSWVLYPAVISGQ